MVKKNNVCPVCNKEMISIIQDTISDAKNQITINDISTSNLSEIHYYTNMRLDGLSSKDILQIVKSGKNINQVLNEESNHDKNTFNILKSQSYFSFGMKSTSIITLIIFPILSLMFAIVFSIISVLLNSSFYPLIILVAIDFLILIYLLYNFIKAFRNFSKRWFAMEFQKDFIKVLHYAKFPFHTDKQIITISEIAEFELGFVQGLNKNKLIQYLTITMKDNMSYYFGEIFNGKLDEEKNNRLILKFLEQNYDIPIYIKSTKYQKRRNRILAINIPIAVTFALLNIISLILSIIYSIIGII
ncbi:MAG: hypothetical protein JXA54_02445 [Candidatus Heimdallarchaeota archaeon]|nr:hypothetical protein [Candidatus Heimdallarchaeota archaeon]